MDELRRELESDHIDTPSEPVQPDRSYWKEIEEGEFVLFIDGDQRAEIATAFLAQVAVGSKSEIHIPPDSMPMMDVVEKRLGIGRVDRVIGKDGRPARGLREELERKAADAAREPHAAAHESSKLLRSADAYLRRGENANTLTAEGHEALRLLTSAFQDLEYFMIWTPKAYQNAREAHRLLGPHLGKIADDQDRAAFYCGLAMPALDRDAEQDAPKYKELPGHGETYWRRADDGFELMVDGHVRATAHHDNSYQIHGSEFGRRPLPDSKVHFTVVEAKLALNRVDDFREADGHRMSGLANPRAKLEREASDVRQNLGRKKEPIAYLRAALQTLENANGRNGRDMAEQQQAAAMLSAALAKLDGRNDRWTQPIFDQVFEANDLLRRAIEEQRLPADGDGARSHLLCEKALSCIDFGDIEKDEKPPIASNQSLRDAAIEKAARQEAEHDRGREQDRGRD